MIAALYDIHANLPALEAVLGELDRIGIDRVVIGGDVVPGPMPRETMARLRSLPWPVDYIYGNGETEILATRRGADTGRVPERFRQVIHWNAERVSSDDAQLMASWPLITRLTVDGIGDVLFCHATPRNDMDIFTRRTPVERLLPIFDPLGAKLVVCGHTHMQFDRMIGATRVVNAGSVGMPFGATGAHWLLIGGTVELQRTPYDLEDAARRVRETEFPLAEELAVRYILDPPSEDSMLDAYAAAEVK